MVERHRVLALLLLHQTPAIGTEGDVLVQLSSALRLQSHGDKIRHRTAHIIAADTGDIRSTFGRLSEGPNVRHGQPSDNGHDRYGSTGQNRPTRRACLMVQPGAAHETLQFASWTSFPSVIWIFDWIVHDGHLPFR